MPIQGYKHVITDNNSETGEIGLNVDTAATTPQLDALRDAINDLSIGTGGDVDLITKTSHSTGSDAASANKFAQRENKFVMKYQDSSSGHKYSASIPSADLAEQVNEEVDLTAGKGLALKTAFEAIVKSRDDNATTLNQVVFRTSRN